MLTDPNDDAVAALETAWPDWQVWLIRAWDGSQQSITWHARRWDGQSDVLTFASARELAGKLGQAAKWDLRL